MIRRLALAGALALATAAGAQPTIGLKRDPQLAAVLAEIRPARIRATDSALVAFGTRNTFSDTLSRTRGIGAARRWLHAQLSAVGRSCGGRLRVEFDPALVEVARHPQRPTVNVVNVLAWLPGRDTSRVVVIGGHYDSCICSVREAANGLPGSFDGTADAPGADDDGSGSSAVVELARAFAAKYPKGLDATVVFALYAAEEQGLLGSTHLAERLHAQGYRVVAGMTDDIVGNTVADDVGAAARGADVVVTCTTARRPFLAPAHVAPGALVAAVGADGEAKSEIEPALLARAAVVTDSTAQCAAIGDLHHAIAAGAMRAADVRAELGDVVADPARGRRGDDEAVVFDSTGVALDFRA